MPLQVKSMTDKELEAKLEELRTKAPERLNPSKRAKKTPREKTVSMDAVETALAALGEIAQKAVDRTVEQLVEGE